VFAVGSWVSEFLKLLKSLFDLIYFTNVTLQVLSTGKFSFLSKLIFLIFVADSVWFCLFTPLLVVCDDLNICKRHWFVTIYVVVVLFEYYIHTGVVSAA
jgi:hypothetical protein